MHVENRIQFFIMTYCVVDIVTSANIIFTMTHVVETFMSHYFHRDSFFSSLHLSLPTYIIFFFCMFVCVCMWCVCMTVCACVCVCVYVCVFSFLQFFILFPFFSFRWYNNTSTKWMYDWLTHVHTHKHSHSMFLTVIVLWSVNRQVP